LGKEKTRYRPGGGRGGGGGGGAGIGAKTSEQRHRHRVLACPPLSSFRGYGVVVHYGRPDRNPHSHPIDKKVHPGIAELHPKLIHNTALMLGLRWDPYGKKN